MRPRGSLSWLVAAGVGALLFACESPSNPPAEAENAELYGLYQQAVALQERMEAAGAVLPEHLEALNGLVDELSDFQDRYGRDDVLIRHQPSDPALTGTDLSISPNPVPSACRGPCPPSTWYSPTRLCFLSGTTCDPDGRNTVCYYQICLNFPIWFAKGALPTP
ncbi:MAG: hypothetical protein R3E10_19625 [Gemmatimonadota bacterium]